MQIKVICLRLTCCSTDVTADEYDALVLPGGALNADSLRMVEEVQQWARDFLEDDKPVAVICHAPWVLVSADIVDGRRLTGYETIQDDIQNAGGEWVDQPVVIDGSLITSRKPDDLPAFIKALITMLRDGLPAETADAIQSEGKSGNRAIPFLMSAQLKMKHVYDRSATISAEMALVRRMSVIF